MNNMPIKDKLKLVAYLAVDALKTNKGRTFLTTVGIVIGIATIVIVLSAGRGLENYIIEQVETFGSDTIEVEIKIPNVSDLEMVSSFVGGAEITTLKVEDFEAIQELQNVENYYAGILGQFKSVYRNQDLRTTIFAVTAGLPEIDKELNISEGRFFTEREENAQERIIVLGPEIKNSLFGGENAIGKTVKINQVNFKVIGVTEPRGTAFYMNFDKMIYIPLETAQKQLMGLDHVLYGFLSVEDTERIDETVQDITMLLRRRHGLPPNQPDKDDFRVTSMQEALEILGVVTFGATLLVLAVAAISLIVGGVGIMNIMYLTVLERTQEIGLRKAIGASNSLIKNQFLAEALIITTIGGIIGIIIGSAVILFIGWIASIQGFEFELTVTPDAILLGFASSLIFGVIFGLYPARKAAELNPTEALRYE
jgi:putative ABC transport system permease protein